ncbi:hypothetical protein [Oricola sp.]|uniref:hypothetical protein n=1 Tax=Oricola sp. TaxID=1979950 RepID=UPI003513B0F5
MAHNIIDAEFETIRHEDDRHPVRKVREKKAVAARQVPDDQIDILKSQPPGRNLPSRRAQIAYILSVLFSSIAAFLVSGGHVLLHGSPSEPAILALEVVQDPAGERLIRPDVTTVSAKVRNATKDSRQVPDVLLTFSSVDGTGNLVYRVPRGETLEPGKSLAFTVRMPKKPGYAQAPSLKFDINGV